ncbi:hypothetical protein P872_22885 [Rhodonellum psychrophilum GCM71 = DSM 17998]|uniref:DUF4221 domain-containing protein n=2 Tax=Rhodonellum TaxID=336827 RepID=U5BW96_9BACT|nr:MULTISPECIES: DUF4221 family protein [Rhodonellum]ERM84910.1 hypothetical protein P872_22885 [Rhodonellum psychrophilum GCM71 = DSM 17998]SDY73452.1 protein of unknown function [Rhodonellum ikkaensis]
MDNQCIFLTASLFFLLLMGCTTRNESESAKTLYSDKKISFGIDTLTIKLNKELNFDYPYSSRFFDGSETYFVGYNSGLHKLDFFSLEGLKYSFSTILEKDGPNGMDDPWDFFIQSLDSIYYLGKDSKLTLLDTSGKVLSVFKLEDPMGNYGYKANPITFKIFLNQEKNKMYLNSYSFSHLPNNHAYFKEPFVSFIDLRNSDMDTIPIQFPKIYLETDKILGEYMEPNVIFVDNRIIYSFPADPSIYTYNLTTKEKEVFGGESLNSKNSIEYMAPDDYHDIQKRIIHQIENTYFYNVVHDPFRKLFYRIHSGGVSFQIDEDDINSVFEKPIFLTVFDENFNILQEMELPSKTYNALSMFVTKSGLHLPFSHYLNQDVDEGKLVFHVYKFEMENTNP